MIDLPYFDMLLEGRRRGEPAARVFENFVHWGYWADPSKATLDVSEFVAAMSRLNEEVLAGANLADGQAVLDAGCGFGGTLASIQKKHPASTLTGLNIDARQLEHARAQVPGARFVEGDACAMPFPDASFDRVLAVECIFHFPSRLKFLKEAARVLKPGGRVSLSDFVPRSTRAHGGWLGRRIEAAVEKGYGSAGDGWVDGDYAAMARAAGLRVVVDRDITAETLPTYPVLTALLTAPGTPAEARDRMLWSTRILEWVSRLRFVRYRIVAFLKPGVAGSKAVASRSRVRLCAKVRDQNLGTVRHYTGTPSVERKFDGLPVLPVADVLLIEEQPEGFFLYRLTQSGDFVTDTWHKSLSDALEQAEFEYGNDRSDWKYIPDSLGAMEIVEVAFEEKAPSERYHRQMTVRGDYNSTGLWDDLTFLEINPKKDLNLPDGIVEGLQRLVRDCVPIIVNNPPWIDAPAKEKNAVIQAIDGRGLELTKEIGKFLGEGYRLRYYSEGLRKYLDG